MENVIKSAKYFFIIIIAGAIIYSCKGPEKIAVTKVRPMSTGRLIKRVEQNAFSSKYLTIKRINCLYENGGNKTSFKANLRSIRNKKIVVSFSKLNIPVGRVILTPDSVVYINYIDKDYFVDDYSYLSNILNIGLNFEKVQLILSNNIFSYRNDPKERDFKNFISDVEGSMYIVKSYKNRKLNKINLKGKTKKIERMLKRLDEDALVLQTVYIEPGSFNLVKIKIEDKSNKRLMKMDFDDYSKVGEYDYPGLISVKFISPEGNISIRIRMAGFSTGKINNLDITIPKRYERQRVN